MANYCGDRTYLGCPASFYTTCKAYKEGLNCWEVDNKPCCNNTDISVCKSCKVYIKLKPKHNYLCNDND